MTALIAHLRRETTGGALLLIAAAVALIWANSPWREAYRDLGDLVVGPAVLHLDLALSAWASDAVLAVFFLVVGLELKHELVVGALSDVREAVVPVVAAVGGVLAPAAIYLAVAGRQGAHGWAIPAATDIAFALAVLAVFGRGLPGALRLFLLTLAVVDDLIAIVVIAVFYTGDLEVVWLLPTAALLGLFAALVRRRRPPLTALVALAVAVWVLMHASGVHATVAGVLLGLLTPARPTHGEARGRAEAYAHALAPASAGLALPVFAFFAAGVTVVDGAGPGAVLSEPVALGVIAGLVVGKVAGVLLTTALPSPGSPRSGSRRASASAICFRLPCCAGSGSRSRCSSPISRSRTRT